LTITETESDKAKVPIVLGGGDMLKLPSFITTKKGSDDIYTGASIRIPLVDSEYGASFGEEIADLDRETGADRMGIGHFLVYRMAKDALKKWFTIDDPETDNPDPELDRRFQRRLREVNAREELRKALEWERLYGKSIIVGRFTDATTQAGLATPKKDGASLVEIKAYPKPKITSTIKEKNVDSDRYGEPVYYYINRGGVRRMKLHYTRVIKVATRTGEKSVIDSIYDCLSTIRNILWALGQTMWRDGTGFPRIRLNGKTVEQLEKFKDDGTFANLMSRSYVLLNEDMEFDFIGAEGKALNPGPYLKPQLEDVAAGTGIPEAILRGAQAGALTGSEVNERQYWDGVATIQRDYEPTIRAVNAWALPDEDPYSYEFVWLPGVEQTEETLARTTVLQEQANHLRLEYMTVNEVRIRNNITPNVEGGEKVPGIERLAGTAFRTLRPEAKAPGALPAPQAKTDQLAAFLMNLPNEKIAKIVELIEKID